MIGAAVIGTWQFVESMPVHEGRDVTAALRSSINMMLPPVRSK